MGDRVWVRAPFGEGDVGELAGEARGGIQLAVWTK